MYNQVLKWIVFDVTAISVLVSISIIKCEKMNTKWIIAFFEQIGYILRNNCLNRNFKTVFYSQTGT